MLDITAALQVHLINTIQVRSALVGVDDPRPKWWLREAICMDKTLVLVMLSSRATVQL